MRTVRRLLELWRMQARLDALMLVRSPMRFGLYVINDLLVNAGGFLVMLLLAERFDGIGPWSKWQLLFMLAYASFVGGITYMFFSYNVAFISRRVGRGQLDHSLVQPQPLWLVLLTEGFSPCLGTVSLLPGLALGGWALAHLRVPFGPGWLALLGLNVLGSTAVYLAFSYIWGSLAFWAPRGAEEINSSSWDILHQLKGYPLDVAGGVLGGLLLTVVPVGFVGWYPSRALLGLDMATGAGLATPAAGLAFGLIALCVFRMGLGHYRRTGSQRYLSRGHRM